MTKKISNIHVGLISYQIGHHKTWKLAHRFRLKGYRVTIYGFPFTDRPKNLSLFSDRPQQIFPIDVDMMSKKYGFDYVIVDSWSDECALLLGAGDGSPQVYVVCIGKIIPPAFLENRVFINAHPGLLPQNRGVDAFKWSVINGWPIGVTIHIIDNQIDGGLIIRRERIPIYPSDNFKTVASRNYELECDMLVDFKLWLDVAISQNWRVDTLKYPLSKSRISNTQDNNINELFIGKVNDFISLSSNFQIHPHASDYFYAGKLNG